MLIGAIAVASASAARGATITVDTVGDPGPTGTCDLRDAITNANHHDQSGSKNCAAGTGTDTIQFSVTGTIKLGSALAGVTDAKLTIKGPGGGITIDGGYAYQVMMVNSGAVLNLHNLTIAGGYREFWKD